MEYLGAPCPLLLTLEAAQERKIFKQEFQILLSAMQSDEKPDIQKIAVFLNMVGDQNISKMEKHLECFKFQSNKVDLQFWKGFLNNVAYLQRDGLT